MAVRLRPLVYFGNNPLTMAGAVVTTSSALTLVAFWSFDLLSGAPLHPYTGVIFFLILPGFFTVGLVLIPIGIFFRRRKLAATGQLPSTLPTLDLGRPFLQRALAWVAGLTIVNVALFGIATYRGVEYMDSASFCGQTCHTVMEPEYTAYQNSPHQRVACVQCHIGPGAGWFARSKLSGIRQVIAVTLKTYDRPIPSPVQQLRPARETCEQCHWPQVFTGDKFTVITHFSDDEKNTPKTTVLLLKIGGHNWQGAQGIHGRHLDAQSRIEYIATDGRRKIPVVRYTGDDGKIVEYRAGDVDDAALKTGERRAMDCMDCHNRPTHVFQMPEPAVDQALADGRISKTLPFVRKKAVELLMVHYDDSAQAKDKIAADLSQYYQSSYPDVYRDRRADVNQAAAQIQTIWGRNIFPAMNVTWGSYPNNLGHTDFPGCFRCHDGSHTSADGRTITNDCSACHTLLAADDPNPKILQELANP